MNAAVALPPKPSDAQVIAAVTAAPPPVPPFTYELALVMGGTVSSGAYTAGAVDFLIEALDCFAAEKKTTGARYHDVLLNVLCGTSGGAVIAAIMARALNYKFAPQAYQAPAPGPGENANPLYTVWVKLLNLAAMLDTSDITTGVPSLLNVEPINEGINFVVNYPSADPTPFRRDWLGTPLTVILTHTNLSGIPYNIDFGSGQSQRFINHADYAQFAVTYPWQMPALAKPYEFSLNFSGQPVDIDWAGFGKYAAASAAFPIGFVTRLLDRPLAQYYYRVICTAMPPRTTDDVHVLQPDWDAILDINNDPLKPGNIRYSTVDGGVVDNEPVQLARMALAGMLGQNPRGSLKANRSVWLIDPFAGETDMASYNMPSIADAAGATLNAALQQCRYSTADLVLALSPDIYSRFMLSAQRDGLTGGKALATAGLDAFMGFACEAFRSHDFYLGRQNCKDFLLNQFRQSAQNPVFDGWTAAQKANFIDKDGDLPIIPLFGSATNHEAMPGWPAGEFNPQDLHGAIEARLDAILVKELFPDNFFGQIFGTLAGAIPASLAANYAVSTLQAALKDWGLA
jgi:hypothetical protein